MDRSQSHEIEPQLFPGFLTPEMERRVRDSLRIVNIEHVSAGRRRKTEALALKVFDEIAMLHSRGLLNDEQKFAAEKLQRDFHAMQIKNGSLVFDYKNDRVDNRTPLRSDDDRAEQLDAIDRYFHAIRIIPRRAWPVVRDVVLADVRLEAVPLRKLRSTRFRRAQAKNLLITGLDELCRFYGFIKIKRKKHAKTLIGSRTSIDNFGSSAVVEPVSESA